MKRLPTLVMTLLGAAVTLVAAVASWPTTPYAPVAAVLLADVVVVVLAIVAVVLAGRAGRMEPPPWTLWIASGTLLGAVAAGPLRVAPWLLAAALAVAAAGVFAGLGGLGGTLRRIGLVCAAALVNFVFLWSATLGDRPRLAPAEFQVKDFRVNSFLADVPLHDVWVFQLRGGSAGLTLRDAQEILSSQSPFDANTTVAVLVGLRMFLGGVLAWDDERHFDTSASYVNRLTDDDRTRTLEQPGAGSDLFKTVYTFENESLAEMMNRTAHAFFCIAMEPASDGYTMYWAIYVSETSALTPVYMAIIDPFRRYIVYPAIVDSVERTWARAHAPTNDAGG
ncbi:MAG: DUF2867 domain-containing protein [Gemmatimonadota bacterium]|nr:MAG: DUF2867 domain-containing protein [Gemmatimonadota bacterium]